MLFLVFNRVFKSMYLVSFDSPAETDVVRRSPTSTKGFVEALKTTTLWGGWVKRRKKTVKHGKVGVKRRWWALAQPPHSLQGNGRQ